MMSWCLMSSDVIWHIRDKLWPMPKHGCNKIHIRKVYACLAVTCHLHFWQNDRDFLRATVVTRGWNGYRNKSQHRKSTLEKKILPPFQQGFEPATFQSRVRCSNHWAIPAPLTWDSSDFTLVLEVHAPQYFFLFCFGCCWFYILKFWWGVCFTCPVPAFVRSFLYFLYVPHIPCSPPPFFFFSFFFFFWWGVSQPLRLSQILSPSFCLFSFVRWLWGGGGGDSTEWICKEQKCAFVCMFGCFVCM